MGPRFLDLAEVIELHADQIERYGGSPGIRDVGLLQSALAMPESGAGGEFFHGDLYEMAGAYLFHLVKNHPFVDGNKRAGTAAALIFLMLNGIQIEAASDALAELVENVAAGINTKSEVVAFLRALSTRMSRMARAEAKKKWERLSHFSESVLLMRR